MIGNDKKTLLIFLAVFLAAFFIPFGQLRVQSALLESFLMLQEYARQHVLLCLVPALFIAGAISVFVSRDSVIKYLGAKARKTVAYAVASTSGAIMAVCSCTILPLFAGIYTRGAGLGPAVAFLYSGPAINVLAIILTAKVLGWKLGLARALGAMLFSVVIGLLMAFIFRKEEQKRQEENNFAAPAVKERRRPAQNIIYFAVMVGLLVFMNWSKGEASIRLWYLVYQLKWYISAILFGWLVFILFRWFGREELREWGSSTWILAKQILPLLLAGVLLAGFLLGRPGHEGLIPSSWISSLVGGNSLWSNLFASVAGALMYFATLTEVPILQGLLGSGMGQGPALALLLAGPAVSLPSLLVIRSIMGTKKTLVYLSLVIVMATLTGLVFGWLVG
ncbi:MAG: permease [Candidatus Saccharicenans sp.]|nr:permease [Candidatus Saccharicenans sp.]